MGAVYGLVGEGDAAEVRQMGSRMNHRGDHPHVWSPAPNVYFGERSRSNGTSDAHDTLALDESVYRFNAPNHGELMPRHGLRRIFETQDLTALRTVRGTFAAAHWDDQSRSLSLAVDHLGYKSLYFCILAGRVAFASEYKAFFALQDFRPEIDPVAIQYHQALRIAMPWRPSLANVKMVRSGSITKITGGRIEEEFYWRPAVNETARPIEESAKLVREQLSRTIDEQTRMEAHVGISLSGGIDSAIVAACATEVKESGEVSAYSVGYAETDPELMGARQVADHLGISHDVTIFDAEDIRKYLPEMVWLMEDCTAREETLLHLKMFQSGAKKEPVILHGVGADLLFGGMPRHKLIAYSMRLPALRQPFLELYQYSQSGHPPDSATGKALAWAVFRGKNVAPPRIANSADPTLVGEPRDLNQYLANSAANMSSVHYTEPMAEQNGFELRAPFLDPDAVDLALSIPMQQKSGWRKQKLVLRESVAELLPEHITRRPKTIHRLQHDVLLSEALDAMAEEAGGLEHIRKSKLVEAQYLDCVRTRKRGRPYGTDQLYRLWTLVSLEIWLRQFVDGGGQYWDFSG